MSQDTIPSSFPEIERASEDEARQEGEVAAAGGLAGIIALLRRLGVAVWRAAVQAAKRGRGAFMDWVNSLSPFNPLKWAIKLLPDVILHQLIDWLAGQALTTEGPPASTPN
ncbi:hypothetical protein GCM10017673_32450 [Streptosporangium violaceochromogenes]|nr:hypothetical protein GCM10017673_32450 [Streptosporangium violaceochromogenes]